MATVVALIAALGFLTALPVPDRWQGDVSPERLARAVGYFPLVGALLGLLLVGVDWALAPVLPLSVRSALAVAVTIALTRGLHLDGLIDSCDGLFGGFTPERRLTIMRDSAIGAFGVLGAVMALLIRYASLGALHERWRLAGLLLAPVAGRWAIAYALLAYPYARDAGLGLAFKAALRPRDLALASLIATAIGGAVWWPWGIALLAPVWLCAWLCARFITRRIPGLSGDSYGAVNEVVEVTLLLALVAGQSLAGGGLR